MRMRSLLVGAVVSGLSFTAAQAADFGAADSIYNSPLFNFDGFYVGAQAGGAWMWTPAPGVVSGTLGGVAGANFGITDAFLGGVEFQASTYVTTSGFVGYDALFLGHFGGYITDSAVIYAALGAGVTNTSTVYALGGGLEAAVGDRLSARGEVLALAPWGTMPTGAKATLGLIWHLN